MQCKRAIVVETHPRTQYGCNLSSMRLIARSLDTLRSSASRVPYARQKGGTFEELLAMPHACSLLFLQHVDMMKAGGYRRAGGYE